jgi:hypothetical protein
MGAQQDTVSFDYIILNINGITLTIHHYSQEKLNKLNNKILEFQKETNDFTTPLSFSASYEEKNTDNIYKFIDSEG